MASLPILASVLVAPGYAVAGVLLASVPVLIHLLNRRRYRVEKFAAMHLLLRAVQKTRSRLLLEHWLLLALRCGVLMLLGLSLARPISLSNSASASLGGRTGLHVFVIDNGYSMAYSAGGAGGKTHLQRALAAACDVIDHLNSGGESVVILTAGKPFDRVIAEPTFDLQQAKLALNSISQSYASTDLAGAFQAAIDIGRAHEEQPGKALHIFTDATASAWQGADAAAVRVQGPELAALYQVSLADFSTPAQWNQAVLDVRPSTDLVTTNTQFGADFFADVKGFGTPHEAVLQWKIDGQLVAGGGRLIPGVGTPPQIEPQANLQSALRSGPVHVLVASLVGDDGLATDNLRYHVTRVVPHVRTLIVEGRHTPEHPGGPAVNLRAALTGQNDSGRPDGLATPELIGDAELADRPLNDVDAVILCGVREITAVEADQLQAFVHAGGTLMVFAGENASAENYNAVWAPRHLIPGRLVNRVVAAAGTGFNFDFNPNSRLHPLLKAFAHQTNTGLETAQAFGYWHTEVAADSPLRVLDWKSPPGSPPDAAITQQRVGEGLVVFVSTSADESWITFTRKPVYTELINELLGGSVIAHDQWMNLTIGERLTVPAGVRFTVTPVLISPGGKSIPLERLAAPGGTFIYRSPALTEPGVHTLPTGAERLPIAVNVPDDASDVHTIDHAALRNSLGNIDVQIADGQPGDAVATAPATGRDWSWLLLVCVAVVALAESVSAGRFDRAG